MSSLNFFDLYLTWSPIYIIDLQQLYYQVVSGADSDLETWIKSVFYYQLPNDQIKNFGAKIKHNIQLLQNKEILSDLDIAYAQYLHHKFQLDQNPLDIDLDRWTYQRSPKIKLIPKSRLQVSQSLLTLLELDDQATYSQIIKEIHRYIRIHRLQDLNHKRTIIPDQALTKALQLNTFTYFQLPQIIRPPLVLSGPNEGDN
jgi:hypothetical protein